MRRLAGISRLAIVLAIACADSAAMPSGDASSGATVETASATSEASATEATTTGATTMTVDPCEACEAWESCVDGTCVPLPGHCGVDDDCAAGQLCVATHECVCDEGLFANAGKCVDRILFALPMDNPEAALISDVVGFDNDPAVGQSDLDCVSYDGEQFPRCYDGHDGTDFILRGGFNTMDNGSAAVFAAADGEVVFVHDGEFDRCALNLQAAAVQCEDGGPVTPANAITVLHADGVSTRYLHLMKNSIVVAEGDRVVCGQPMALVGSSGNSSMPHLHFEVQDIDGNSFDAYAGRYSHPESSWAEQDGAHDLPGAACQ